MTRFGVLVRPETNHDHSADSVTMRGSFVLGFEEGAPKTGQWDGLDIGFVRRWPYLFAPFVCLIKDRMAE